MPYTTKRGIEATVVSLQDFHLAGAILYVIVLGAENAGEFTSFQGFSLNALDSYVPILQICRLPAHVSELFQGRVEVARSRMYGQTGYSILLLEVELFEQLREYPGFVCVISSPTTYSFVSKHFASRNNKRWLHLTTMEEQTIEPKLWDVNRRHIYAWTKEAALEIMSTREASKPQDSELRSFKEWDSKSAPISSRSHNILKPTEAVYLSLGYHFDLPAEPLVGNDDQTFAYALANTARELEKSLTELVGDNRRPPGFPSIILTVPSVFRHMASLKPRKGTSSVERRAFRAVTRQKQYIAFRASPEEAIEFLNSDVSGFMLHLRARELFLYTAAVSVAACSLCCPSLRLPPQLDLSRDLLLGLVTLCRKGNAAQRRRNQLALLIGQTYRGLLPEPLRETIDGLAHTGIKLIGDVPLELLLVDGLPLSLRCSVSRLPTLPGNLLVRHSLMRVPLYLNQSDFHDILVVRSFQSDDPLRNLIEVSIDAVLDEGASVKVKIVDVSSEEEFIAAFNSFDGKLAIFDGHGTQFDEGEEGTLQIGSFKLNPIRYYGRIKVPPIVILSACETYTVRGFEASVASAFVFLGARSVLGTIAPIDAMSAAQFVARFLLRLEAFLPTLSVPVNWTEVVTGMLRMSYVTDVIRKFEHIHGTPIFHFNRVQMVANIAIIKNEASWFTQVIKALSDMTNETEQQVKDRWLDTCYFAETLRYVHLGVPEHIVVVPG